jgi:sugar lactone lactonase YvrE
MCSKTRFLGIATALTLLAALLTVAAMPVQVGADGQIEVVKQYDALEGELPEGIAVDKKGNLYVSLGAPSPLSNFAQIRKISPDGSETVLVEFEEPAAAGLAVDAPGNVYYAHFSFFNPDIHGVYRVTRDGATQRLPGTDAILFPNALAFDKVGNLYVSDSWLGAIWRIPRGGSAELWLQHELLEGLGEIPGYPPIGANGIACRHGSLYVANTEKGLIARIPILTGGDAGDPQIVAEDPGLYGLDGIALDVHGNIYAALVLQSKLVRIDPVDGEFTTLLTADDGLDEPASLAFGTGKGDRQSVFVTNYALFPPHSVEGPAVLKVDVGVPGLPLP